MTSTRATSRSSALITVRVGGPFSRGAPMVIVHTVGAKSGQPRTNIMMYLADGERYLVFASNNGRDDNPAWYWNLKANPRQPHRSWRRTSSTCMPPCCRAPSGTTKVTQCRPSGIRDSRSTNARHRGPSQLSPSRPTGVAQVARNEAGASQGQTQSTEQDHRRAPRPFRLTSPKGIVFSQQNKYGDRRDPQKVSSRRRRTAMPSGSSSNLRSRRRASVPPRKAPRLPVRQ